MRKISQLGWDLALVCAIAAMIAGVWFGFLSWKLTSTLFGMLAVLLILAGPVMAVAVIVARPNAPGEDGAPPEGVLIDGIHRIDSALRIVSLGRAHMGVLASYVVVLWICEAARMVSLEDFLVFFTFACTATSAAYLPWLASRERRLYDERAEFQRRLGEMEAARG